MDLKHDKVSVSETMSQSEPKYEIKRDPYHEAKLVYSGQNSQGTRSYHTERVNAPSVSNNVIHSVHGILTKVFKTHSITTDLIDGSYLYGAGIDLQWNTDLFMDKLRWLFYNTTTSCLTRRNTFNDPCKMNELLKCLVHGELHICHCSFKRD